MTQSTDSKKGSDDRRQEAAEWLVRLQQPKVSPEDLLQSERWLQRHPDNQKAFDEAEQLDATVEYLRDDLASIALPNEAELAADRYDGSVPVTAWYAERNAMASARSRALRAPTWLAMAAALVMAVGVVVTVQTGFFEGVSSSGLLVYETAESEHRDVALPDGSSIVLGAASALSVNFSADRRAVVMEAGEALFEVAKDPDRPFVVVAGSGTITAIGTSFNVRRDADRVVVTVTEGRVEVTQTAPPNKPRRPQAESIDQATQALAHATLAAGERAVYGSEGLSRLDNVEPVAATVWREGRLRYRAEPLKYVIPDVDRYSTREIIIGDDSVGELTFTGTVFQSNVDEWVQQLDQVFDVDVVEMEGDKVLLRSASPSPE